MVSTGTGEISAALFEFNYMLKQALRSLKT